MPTIRELRTQKGLTREQLARRVNVTLRTLASYEAGERKPLPVIRDALARALGVRPNDITDVVKGESEEA